MPVAKDQNREKRLSVEIRPEVRDLLDKFKKEYPRIESEGKIGRVALEYYLQNALERGFDSKNWFPPPVKMSQNAISALTGLKEMMYATGWDLEKIISAAILYYCRRGMVGYDGGTQEPSAFIGEQRRQSKGLRDFLGRKYKNTQSGVKETTEHLLPKDGLINKHHDQPETQARAGPKTKRASRKNV